MKTETAIFGAGCFWGVQYYFDQVPGVLRTEAGYTGGYKDNPTYEDVLSHTTGHAESLKITFDPSKVSYETLLKHFFRIQDPTSKDAPDGINRGDNYRSVIFYQDETQQQAAADMIEQLIQSGRYNKPIATTFEPAGKWWPAEDFHQKFTEKTGRGACHIDYSPV